MKMQTYGQGYGNWQKYALPKSQQTTDQPSQPVAPPAVDSSSPTMPNIPVPVGVKPLPQNPEDQNTNPTGNSTIGDSWSTSLSNHFGPY